MRVALVDHRDYYDTLSVGQNSRTGVIIISSKPDQDPEIHKILTNVGKLQFSIAKREHEITVSLFSHPESFNQERCILERLYHRFQDRVKISVDITYIPPSNSPNRIAEASVQGMTIEKGKGGCCSKGSGRTSDTLFDASRFKLTVTAVIPKDCLVVVDNSETDSNDGIHIGKTILETESFSDVIIVAVNGAEIQAHRNFLSVRSSVLDAMFKTDMKESQTGRVEMTDVSEKGVRAFLQFIYYGDLKMPKEDIVIAYELLYAGHKYNVPGLEAKLIKCLMGVKNENYPMTLAFKTYMFVRNMESVSAVELKRKCLEIFNTNMDELESLKEYKDLFEKTPKVAMQVCRDFFLSISRR